MSRVAIVKGTDPPDMAVRAMEMVDAAKAVSADKPVLIKPNYINASHPSTGITTDARVIEGVVAFLKKHDVKEIIIGEGAGEADTLDASRSVASMKSQEDGKYSWSTSTKTNSLRFIPRMLEH